MQQPSPSLRLSSNFSLFYFFYFFVYSIFFFCVLAVDRQRIWCTTATRWYGATGEEAPVQFQPSRFYPRLLLMETRLRHTSWGSAGAHPRCLCSKGTGYTLGRSPVHQRHDEDEDQKNVGENTVNLQKGVSGISTTMQVLLDVSSSYSGVFFLPLFGLKFFFFSHCGSFFFTCHFSLIRI